MFLIYINDLVTTCKESFPFLFADDTNLFISGKQLNPLAEKLNTELNNISTWRRVNKLSLNVKKTHYMIFTTKKTECDRITIRIDGNNIEQVTNTKFLGVYIDNRLSWKKHIDYISGKISRGIGVILKARHLLNLSSLKTLYYSFVYPYFSYCNHVWGSACATALNRLFLLQKRAVRVISAAKYRDPSDPIFKKLGLLKLADINKYSFCKFMYRWYHSFVAENNPYVTSKLPNVFENFFRYTHIVHSHDTRQCYHLYKPPVKTDLGKTRLVFRGPHIWNSILRAEINPDVSELIFTRSIKQCISVGLL